MAAARDGAAGARIARQRSAQSFAWTVQNDEQASGLPQGVLPTERSISSETYRDAKKNTVYSQKMHSGEGMRDALTYCPDHMRRVAVSLSPRGLQSASRRGDVSDEAVDLELLHSGISTSPRPSQTAVPLGSARSPRAHSAFNPRARPRSPRSDVGDGASAVRCRSGSPRFNEDHMWRELFHDERDVQGVPRLREQGKDIGHRGKASLGIPWRQIPSFDRMGMMAETGDPHHSEAMRRAAAMPYRKKSEFGTRHRGGGMKDLLHAGGNENTPPPSLDEKAIVRDPRDAWLDLVKRRQEVKHDGTRTPDEDKRAVHHTYRKQRKSVGADPGSAMKDSCPYYREDSIPEGRSIQPPTPHKRPSLAPQSSMRRSEMSPVLGQRFTEAGLPSERVIEARRDWQYNQDKAVSEMYSPAGAPPSRLSSGLESRCSSTRSIPPEPLGPSSSAKQLALQASIHSVRARPAAPSKQRWK